MKQLALPFLLLFISKSYAADSLIIGKETIPFEIKNIAHYSMTHINTKNLRGKWVILDFWSRGCTACVAAFPEMNQLRKQFADKAELLLVAREDRDHEVDSIYEKARKFRNLDLPSAFDSVAFKRFDFTSVPQILIFDEKGVLRGWVNHLFSQELGDLIDGKRATLVNPAAVAFDYKQPYLLNGNGGKDDSYEYRSIVAKWKKGMPFSPPGNIRVIEFNSGIFQAIGVPLTGLYNLAYLGFDLYTGSHDTNFAKVSLHPILEMKDSGLFVGSMKVLEGRWSYSLAVPLDRATAGNAMRILQNDLNSYFAYSVKVESRDCPYLALVSSPIARANLTTKGGSPHLSGSVKAKLSLINEPATMLADILSFSPNREIVLDETELGRIDITMDEDLTNPSSVLNALHENGLDLVWRKKPMRVVVIKDAN